MRPSCSARGKDEKLVREALHRFDRHGGYRGPTEALRGSGSG